MKGKKSDAQFVSDFISKSIIGGFDSPDKIVNHAKSLIQNIDKEIREIDQKKIIRSKLLDVIASFEKTAKPSRIEEAKILSFFQIQNPRICKYICGKLKFSAAIIDDFIVNSFQKEDIMFCIKQLLEHKIIFNIGNKFLRGDSFEDYLKFVLREDL